MLHEDTLERTSKLRVIGLSPERMVVRVIQGERQTTPEDWVFPTSRIPEEWMDWEIGKEFELTISEPELDYLRGGGDA